MQVETVAQPKSYEVRLQAVITTEAAMRLRVVAAARGVSQGQVITELIEASLPAVDPALLTESEE